MIGSRKSHGAGYIGRAVRPKTLDHVAYWLADRDRVADFVTTHLGMHVIERTDKFTLVGSDARKGKLTLFEAEAPRERGALKHVALRVNDLDAAINELPDSVVVERTNGSALFDLGDGVNLGLVEAPTETEYDLDHVALFSADPEATAQRYRDYGFDVAQPGAGRHAARPGRRRLRRVPRGGAGRPGGAAAQPPGGARRLGGRPPEGGRGPRHRGAGLRGRPEHARGVRLAPGARPARVRRAQADVRAPIALNIAGAGMAGLVAAARARELGAEPVVYEKGTRAGGSMLLSSGFAWRYRSWEVFRDQCPGGDPTLQRLVLERFDDALDWLEAQGVELLTRETGNPLTVGARFDPRQLVDTLAKDVRLGETTDDPTILATGGFPVRLARERGLLLRANPWSEGDGLDLARSRGAETAGDLDEFYGRVMAAVEAVAEADFVRLGQLYGEVRVDHVARTAPNGSSGEPSWSEIDVAQQIARWPGGRAWFTVERAALEERVRDRTVGEMIEAAREAGAPVEEDDGRVARPRPGRR